MEKLNRLDNVLIHYPDRNVLATFYEYVSGHYCFNRLGEIFLISEIDKLRDGITFEIIEED